MRKKDVLYMTTILLLLTACSQNPQPISQSPKNTVTIHADYPQYDTAQDLVNTADLVFSGTVKNLTYEMLDIRSETGADSMTGLNQSQSFPYTLYEIEVTKVYKGTIDGDSITIKCLGGIFDETEYVVSNECNISLGETYLFLTETYEHSYPSLLNVSQALYNMNDAAMINEEEDTITLTEILDLLE